MIPGVARRSPGWSRLAAREPSTVCGRELPKIVPWLRPLAPSAPFSPADLAEGRQARERIQAALAELPAEQRRVLELAYFEGLSQSEIAEKTGDALGTVKTRVRLGMEKLSATLAELWRVGRP